MQLQKEKLSLMALSTNTLIAEREQRKVIAEKYERAASPLPGRPSSPLKGSVDVDWFSTKDIFYT